MSAPATYSDLKDRILEYLAEAPTSEYASDADLFIDLAESRFNADLVTRNQQASSSLTPDANGEMDLPDDYAAFDWATANEGTRKIPLTETSPEWMEDQFPYARSGVAQYITIDGDKIRVRPVTGSTITFRYYRTIPALSSANTTNWLLTKLPGLYLSASLYEAAQFFNDRENAGRYGSMYDDQLALLRRTDRRERMVRRRLSVTGPTP